MIHRILDNSWSFHGRVASREQVQIEISFPHHRPWLDLFMEWWEYGFRSWRRRAGSDDILAFTCELGPKPYAITGRERVSHYNGSVQVLGDGDDRSRIIWIVDVLPDEIAPYISEQMDLAAVAMQKTLGRT